MPSVSACNRSFSGDFGGVMSSSCRSFGGPVANSGADEIVPDIVSDMVLPSPLTLSISSVFAPFFFLRFTTRCFRLRPPWAFPCLFDPSPSPVVADPKLERLGLVACDPLSETSGKTYVVLMLPTCECERDSVGIIEGVLRKFSPRSVGPAQALKTASLMLGVNSDNVLCESVNAARRRRFFCEKSECASEPGSRDNGTIGSRSKGFPKRSTESCGGLARGSTAFSAGPESWFFRASSSSSLARYSGTHSLNDKR